MTTGTLALAIINFLFIGLLPKIFFRQDGKFNFMWFVTASPYFFAPLFVILTEAGILGLLVGKDAFVYQIA